MTEETVSGLLEGRTLAEALEKNKIFLCDLEITDNIECKDNREVSPVCVCVCVCSSCMYCTVLVFPFL